MTLDEVLPEGGVDQLASEIILDQLSSLFGETVGYVAF